MLNKAEKNRLAYLKKTCLDDDAMPLPDAEIDKLTELSELSEKEAVPGPAKAKKEKEPKGDVPEFPGSKYMGSLNGVPHYIREYKIDGYARGTKETRSEAFRVTNGKKQIIGNRFGDRLLAKLKK